MLTSSMTIILQVRSDLAEAAGQPIIKPHATLPGSTLPNLGWQEELDLYRELGFFDPDVDPYDEALEAIQRREDDEDDQLNA